MNWNASRDAVSAEIVENDLFETHGFMLARRAGGHDNKAYEAIDRAFTVIDPARSLLFEPTRSKLQRSGILRYGSDHVVGSTGRNFRFDFE